MASPSNNLWITCPRPNPRARLRLFCFPYAGGGTSIFIKWPDELSHAIEICPVRAPGRESRIKEAPFTRLTDMVTPMAQAIRPYLDKPFAFFGHSLGGLVSFELARQLRRQADPGPVHLLVSAYRAPQLPNPNAPIYQLPDQGFLDGLRRLNGMPEAVLQHAELIELFLPLLRADFTVHETYIYAAEPPLDCPISAFGGLQDPEARQTDLAGWREQTHSTFTIRMFPGDHFYLHTAQTSLLNAIARDLAAWYA